MKRVNGKNQQGSVMLAVVCMGMMAIVMATTVLGLVNATNRATARNVMRTQAKVTAEACLTEFVGAYSGTDPVTLKPNYEKLQTLANGGTEASPVKIKVNPGNTAFDQSYGDTSIYVYKVNATTFKVKSVCTFGGEGIITPQKQSASVVFASALSTPQLPSNALEASEGVDGSYEMACAVAGDIYLEKKKIDTDGDGTPDAPEPDRIVWIGAQDTTYNSNLYSEFSLKFGNGVIYEDTVNKTGTQNYEPNKSTHVGSFFTQAPTIWTEGYFIGYNRFKVKTDCGKTDVDLWNHDSNPTGYKKDNLENMDGFIYAKQQAFMFNTSTEYVIGEDKDHPIDLYCAGLYSGQINKYTQKFNVTNGSYDAAEVNPEYIAASGVKDKSGNTAIQGNGSDNAFTINGNLYCYDNGGPSGGANKPGNLYIMNGDHTCTINGDVFVEHDLIVTKQNNSVRLQVNGTLHVGGSIYVVDMNGDTMKLDPRNSATISGNAIVNNPLADANYKPTTFVKATKGYSQYVDKNDTVNPRNARPTDGYNASTGLDSGTRKTLKDTYKEATPNNIFEASLNTSHTYNAYSKAIAEKYARAMATPFSETAKYKTSTGAIKNLVDKHDVTVTDPHNPSNTENVPIYVIKSSCRLTKDDYQRSGGAGNLTDLKVYSVKLTDEDIVIALPLNDNVIPLIRVDSTERTGDTFVYFAYYNNSSSDLIQSGNTITVKNCLYLSDTATLPSGTGSVLVNNVWTGSSFENITVKYTASTAAYRSTKTVKMDAGGKNICYCADITLYTPYEEGTPTSPRVIYGDEFVSFARSKLEESTVADYAGEGFQNYLIYYVPDDVAFYLGDNSQIQGILYAPASYVTFGGSGTRIFGQVKCKRYTFGADIKPNKVIYQIPAAEGSILDYISAANSSSSNIEIQYYEY